MYMYIYSMCINIHVSYLFLYETIYKSGIYIYIHIYGIYIINYFK